VRPHTSAPNVTVSATANVSEVAVAISQVSDPKDELGKVTVPRTKSSFASQGPRAQEAWTRGVHGPRVLERVDAPKVLYGRGVCGTRRLGEPVAGIGGRSALAFLPTLTGRRGRPAVGPHQGNRPDRQPNHGRDEQDAGRPSGSPDDPLRRRTPLVAGGWPGDVRLSPGGVPDHMHLTKRPSSPHRTVSVARSYSDRRLARRGRDTMTWLSDVVPPAEDGALRAPPAGLAPALPAPS
jgi:hypothetical protein